MFQTLRNAFKVKDIRSKIFYTFLMLVVFEEDRTMYHH